MALCNHVERIGIVTNQPGGYDAERPHAAISICSRPKCKDSAIKWVAGETNETAVFVPDKMPR